jgi:hypothetical protein
MGTVIGKSSFLDEYCADFNGTDEYAQRNDPSFETNTAGSVSVWLRPDTTPANGTNQSFFGYGINAASNAAFHLALRGVSGTIRLSLQSRLTNNGTVSRIVGDTAISTGGWVHVVAQGSGSAWTLYVNGVAQTITVESGSNNGRWIGSHSPGSSNNMTWGANWVSNAVVNYFDGRMNEAVMCNRILTAAEVTEIYNAGVTSNPNRLTFRSNIVCWLRFGDSRDNATTLFCEVGADDFTLVNMDASNYVAV